MPEAGDHILAVQCVAGMERRRGSGQVSRTPHVDMTTLRPHDPHQARTPVQIRARFRGHVVGVLGGGRDLDGQIGCEGSLPRILPTPPSRGCRSQRMWSSASPSRVAHRRHVTPLLHSIIRRQWPRHAALTCGVVSPRSTPAAQPPLHGMGEGRRTLARATGNGACGYTGVMRQCARMARGSMTTRSDKRV